MNAPVEMPVPFVFTDSAAGKVASLERIAVMAAPSRPARTRDDGRLLALHALSWVRHALVTVE